MSCCHPPRARSTYVGSFAVSDGPAVGPNVTVHSCVEACALLFSAAPADAAYACSTDNTTVNDLAWGSGFGPGGNASCVGGTAVADTYALSSATGSYNVAPSFSAFVNDM